MTDQIERLPPHNQEAEQAVLGSILIEREAAARAFESLNPDSFYYPAHQTIFRAAQELFEKGQPLDIITVSDVLRQNDLLDKAGGYAYLLELTNAIPSTANIGYYSRIVDEKFILRCLIRSGNEIISAAYDSSEDVTSILDMSERKIFEISQRKTTQNIEHIKPIIDHTFETISQRYDNPDLVVPTGVSSGLHDLDRLLGGLQPSDLIIVAARPAMGKTSLCLSMAAGVAVNSKKPVAIFSLEMSKEQIAQRLISGEAKISANHMKFGSISEKEWDSFVAAVGRLSGAPIFIDDTSSITAVEIRAKCRRLKAEKKELGLVVIDYIQLMEGGGSGNEMNRVQEVAKISRSLKGLARELNVPVIALSQLSRAVEQRQNKRPQLSDLRESGCLTGDTMIYLPDSGTYERIDQLMGQKGFNVLALNTHTWQLESRPVLNAFATGCKPVFKMVTRLGRTIRATGNHKFLTISGWQRLDTLETGMRLALPRQLTSPTEQTMTDAELALLGHLIGDGCTLPRQSIHYTTSDVYWDQIVSIEPDGEDEVYDLTVEGLHNFVANDYIVHNSIEQDADIVMFIYRDEYYNPNSTQTNIAELIIAKHRNGPVGTVQTYFDSRFTRFESLTQSSEG